MASHSTALGFLPGPWDMNDPTPSPGNRLDPWMTHPPSPGNWLKTFELSSPAGEAQFLPSLSKKRRITVPHYDSRSKARVMRLSISSVMNDGDVNMLL